MRGETSRAGTKPVARECAVESRLGPAKICTRRDCNVFTNVGFCFVCVCVVCRCVGV